MKRVLLAVFVALMATGVFAQYQPVKRFSITPHLGLGFVGNVGEVKDYGIALHNGYNVFVGAEVRYRFNNWLSASAALDFSNMQTFKQNSSFRYPDPTSPTGFSDYSGKLHYEFYDMSIPLMAQFYVMPCLSLYTGVQVSFLLAGDVYLTENDNDDAYDQNIVKEVNRWNVFIPVGIRYTFKKPWELALQYNFQATRWNKENEPGYKDARSFPIMLTVGYRFDL